MPAKEIEQAGKTVGFNLDQLKRAKRRIGAESARQGFGPGSSCDWVLPDVEDPPAT